MEQKPEPQRDMSRPHFQRTVSVVMSRELMGQHYELRRTQDVAETLDVKFLTRRAEVLKHYHRNPSAVWQLAQLVSAATLDAERGVTGVTEPPYAIENLWDQYNHAHSAMVTMHEGIETQTFMPLRLAQDVWHAASEQGQSGFEANSLEDVAAMLRRPDFRRLVDKAAFTANGVWESYSVTPAADFWSRTREARLEFVFDAEGNVDFSPKFNAFLLKMLRKVNEKGLSPADTGGNVSEASSAGCPARRLRPSFTKSQQDRIWLGMLSDYFQKSPEELQATHESSVIDQGLDLVADAVLAVGRRIRALQAKPEAGGNANAEPTGASETGQQGTAAEQYPNSVSRAAGQAATEYVCEVRAEVEPFQPD